MNDPQQQIIQLLTQIRDEHRDESIYRRRVLDESLTIQKRCAQRQKIALIALAVLMAFVVALLFGSNFLETPPQQ